MNEKEQAKGKNKIEVSPSTNLKLLFIIVLGVIVFGLGGLGVVWAVECGVAPGANCNISVSTTFNTGIYNLNGTNSAAGAITINASNLVLDLNGSTIVGNLTANSRGIQIDIGSNITIKNGYILNYSQNVRTNNRINISLINITFGKALTNAVDFEATNNTLIKDSTFANVSISPVILYTSSFHANIVNNSFLDSNFQTLRTAGITNLLISNNYFKDNSIGYRPISGTVSNVSIFNNTFFNVSTGYSSAVAYTAINISRNTVFNCTTTFVQEASGTSTLIANNYIDKCKVVRTTGSSINMTIDSNYINNTYLLSTSAAVQLQSGAVSGLIVNNNTFWNIKKGVQLYNATNTSITNNRFYNSTGIVWGGGNNVVYPMIDVYSELGSNASLVNNVLVAGNTFNLTSLAIRTLNATNLNISIRDNQFDQLIGNYDEYDNGFLSLWTDNVTFVNNTFNRIGCVGIMLSTNTDNVDIVNNTFNADLSYNIQNRVNCAYEPVAGIITTLLWKTWEQFSPNNQSADLNYLTKENNSNIYINGNTFGNGLPVLLKSQGTQNLTTDFSTQNSWLASFQTPTFLLARDDYYINLNWENVTTVKDNGGYYPFSDNTSSTDIIGEGRRNQWQMITQFSLHRSYFWFYNQANFSGMTYEPGGNMTQTNLYNLTNALVFNTNGTVFCTSINDCDGNVNLTLNRGNSSYVLEDFNLTEGTSRQFSPLWFSSSSSTSKHIASNLSQAITANVIIRSENSWGDNCDNINKITYTPEGGTTTTWTGGTAKDVCRSLTTTGYALTINPAANSNELDFEVGTTSLATNFLKILMGFLAIAVMLFAVVGFMMYVKNNFQDISVIQFVQYGVLLLLFTIIMIVLINHIANVI